MPDQRLLEASKRWREANRDKSREASRKCMARRRSEQAPAYWFKHLRKRAEDLGYEFDLTQEWIAKQLEPMNCALTGLPLQHTERVGKRSEKQRNPRAPSFDRIDSKRGHTKDNVHVICWALNAAKGPWDLSVFEAVARSYLERQNAR